MQWKESKYVIPNFKMILLLKKLIKVDSIRISHFNVENAQDNN